VGWQILGCSGSVEFSCEHYSERSGPINVEKFLSSCETSSFSRRTQVKGVSMKNVG
jgi:hypothetical protein